MYKQLMRIVHKGFHLRHIPCPKPMLYTFNALAKLAVPLCAIVPRLLISSSLVIPIPESLQTRKQKKIKYNHKLKAQMNSSVEYRYRISIKQEHKKNMCNHNLKAQNLPSQTLMLYNWHIQQSYGLGRKPYSRKNPYVITRMPLSVSARILMESSVSVPKSVPSLTLRNRSLSNASFALLPRKHWKAFQIFETKI